MTNSEAIDIAEGYVEPQSPEQYYAAWQQLIDTGLAGQLQGWFGREAMRLIESGMCRSPRYA